MRGLPSQGCAASARPQQHGDRAHPAIDDACRAIGDDVLAAAQPAAEQRLDHRTAVRRAVALAVDDAHAAQIPVMAMRDELRDREFGAIAVRSEEHTSELQSLMRISYAVFCLKNKTSCKRTLLKNTQHTILT